MTKHRPATPLPWNLMPSSASSLAHIEGPDGSTVCSITKNGIRNAEYIYASSNAYPKLVERAKAIQALRPALLKQLGYVPECVLWECNAARALLAELGE